MVFKKKKIVKQQQPEVVEQVEEVEEVEGMEEELPELPKVKGKWKTTQIPIETQEVIMCGDKSYTIGEALAILLNRTE